MKKVQLFIIILVVIILFAAGDYFVNTPGSIGNGASIIPVSETDEINVQVPDPYQNLTQTLLDSNPAQFDYTIVKRDRTKQIFEKFDMSSLGNVVIYKNTLKKKSDTEGLNPITIYEIQAGNNQGRLAYLNLKLRLIDQMGVTGNLNEVTEFGYNGFFYNDLNNKNTGFLLTQIKDNIYGFEYNKSDEGNFQTIQNMINALMDLDLIL